MVLVLGAVVAGVLTTLAPCVLPLLPVIVGRTAVPVPGAEASDAGTTRVRAAARHRSLVVTTSLGVSVVAFTLLLKATTALIGVPREVWQTISGGLLVAVGITQLWPGLWDAVALRLTLGSRAGERLAAARRHPGLRGDVLTGAALGPVFSSCSPLYGYVVVTVLPSEFGYGLMLLLAYTVGLCATLLVIALLGRQAVARLRWVADPHGWARRVLGALLVAVGLLILTGGDHALQTWVLEHSPIRPWELDSGFIPPS